MGSSWAWNFTQFPRIRFMKEEDMRDIPHPATELGIHIAYKNVEAGSIIGGFLVAPLWPRIRKTGDLLKRKLRHRIGICGRRGMLVGLLITPLMEYAFIKARNVDEDGLRDRCYRLRYNKKQLLIDRTVTVAAIFGWVSLRWTGVVAFTNFAVFIGTFYNALLFDRLRKYKIFGGDEMETPDPDYEPKKL